MWEVRSAFEGDYESIQLLTLDWEPFGFAVDSGGKRIVAFRHKTNKWDRSQSSKEIEDFFAPKKMSAVTP